MKASPTAVSLAPGANTRSLCLRPSTFSPAFTSSALAMILECSDEPAEAPDADSNSSCTKLRCQSAALAASDACAMDVALCMFTPHPAGSSIRHVGASFAIAATTTASRIHSPDRTACRARYWSVTASTYIARSGVRPSGRLAWTHGTRVSERAAPVMATSMPNGASSSSAGWAGWARVESISPAAWVGRRRTVGPARALDAAARRSRSSARKSVYWGMFLSRSPSLRVDAREAGEEGTGQSMDGGDARAALLVPPALGRPAVAGETHRLKAREL